MDGFGKRVQQAREKKGLSQSELARRIGVKPQAIQAIESGRARRSTYVVQIAHELEVAPDWLLERGNNGESSAQLGFGMAEEARPYKPEPGSTLSTLATGPHQFLYEIRQNHLANRGLQAGDVLVFEQDPRAIRAVARGDIVICQVAPKDDPFYVTTVVREYVPPTLLVTNQPGRNEVLSMDEWVVHVMGVFVPHKPNGGAKK